MMMRHCESEWRQTGLFHKVAEMYVVLTFYVLVSILARGQKGRLSLEERFLARDVIYTSRAYATMSVSVCLSVCL